MNAAMRLALWPALVLLFASSCVTYTLTQTAAHVDPKPAGCDFVIATTKLDREYEEVGILDKNMGMASTAADFKEFVRPQVCALGGDAVIAEINGYGYYIRGTVVRWKAQ